MTEQISIGDIVGYGQDIHDTHCKQRTGNTLSTVVGILLGLIVLAVLWATWSRRRDGEFGNEKNTNIELGELRAGQRYLNEGLHGVIRHEREDFGRLMYTDGALRPYPFAAPLAAFGGTPFYDNHNGYGYNGHGYNGHGNCGKHGAGCDSKFQDVKTFNLASEVVTQTNTCNCG